MSQRHLMEPRPPEEDPKPDPDACPNCSWQPWESMVWFYTASIAVVLVLVILANLSTPAP